MNMQNEALWPGWETVRVIGRGNFGTVYEIRRQVFGDTERAALKVISIPQHPGDLDEMYSNGYDEAGVYSTLESHLRSIVAEYSLMRKLNGNTNIVHCDDVHYVRHEDGIGWDIFIKMELLTALPKTLTDQISEDTVITVAKDLCSALELCRQQGIVHRDIKPQNIFVSPNGDYKLGDFGIAKTVEKTMGGTRIGTYQYMAPEVHNSLPYGTGADVYSLGLVLYWMLNERRMPFVPLPPARLMADVEEEARRRRLSGERLPPPKNGSSELKRIVLKACSYAPEDRYPTAAAMLEDLKRLPANGTRMVQRFDETLPPDPRPTGKRHDPHPGGRKEKPTVSLVALAGIGLLLLVLALSFCGKKDDTPELPVKMRFAQFEGRYYGILDTPLTSYEEAAAYCRDLGGHMADVNSAEENRFLYEYLSSLGYDHVFLGGNDIREDGVWEWESGAPFDYANWNEGEPNNDLGGEDHLAMYQVLSDGSWNDISFSTPGHQDGTARIGKAEASSYCTDEQKRCAAAHLIDGDPATAWCTSGTDAGTGESVLFEFTKKERLTGLTIHSGNQSDAAAFDGSRRPGAIRLVFDDGSSLDFELKDAMGEQYLPFDRVVITSSVKLVIDSAYGSDEGSGIAVSEVLFHTEARKTGFVCEWEDPDAAKAANAVLNQP